MDPIRPATTAATAGARTGPDFEFSSGYRTLRNRDDEDDDGDAAHSLKTRMNDSSSVRAHRHAAGGRKDHQEPAQLGRSRGGVGTKVHAVVDGKGQSSVLGLSPGQPRRLPAGRDAAGGDHRTEQRPLDRNACTSRNLVERFFSRIKEFRRVATRYDNRARNFPSAVILAATRCLLRELANANN